MTNFASSIQRLPATALDPDHLEQQFASQLHGPEGAYQLPFLQAAMYDRQRRGQQLAEANQRGNEQAAALAQQEMNVTERGQLRTLLGQLGPHGMPADANLMMIGGMPTPQSANFVAQTANPTLVAQGQGQAARDLGAGAHSAIQGGVDPLAFPGMPQARVTPLGERTAAIGAAGRNRVQFRSVINPNDPDTPQTQVTAPNIEQMQQGQRQLQDAARQGREESTARNMLSQNTRLNAAAQTLRQRAAQANTTVVGHGGDGNHYWVDLERGGVRERHTLDRQGNSVGTPVQQRTTPAR